MRKWIIALVFVFVAGVVFGHPPKVDSIVYDPVTKVLTVTLIHDVSGSAVLDQPKHYVKEADVSVNGEKVITQNFTSQETPKTEVLVYKLLVQPGDKVTVDAVCSIRGTGTDEITIGDKPAQ